MANELLQVAQDVAAITDPDGQVIAQSAAICEMAKSWPVIEALVGGTEAMRSSGKAYLPQWPKEESDAYNDRLGTAVLFNAFGHTTESLSSKPFARPMTITGLADGVENYLNNVDLLGSDIHTFSAECMVQCLQFGLHGVLVEYPQADGIRTRKQELERGVRPYMTHYRYDSILGWKAQPDAKGAYLTQLRLLEQVKEPDGRWAEKVVRQVRVLEPGRWEVWRERQRPNQAQLEWYLFAYGETSIKKIPFVFFYGLKRGFGIGRPPLLNLAHLNVQHWQSSSDQDHILHVARVPIIFAKGFTDTDNLVIGAGSAVSTSNKEAELEYVEHTGQAIGAGRQSLLDIEDRMRQIGAELLVQRPAVTTATQVSSEDETNRSTMQKICEEFEDSMESCLRLMGEWEKKESDPEVKVFKDFKSAQMGEKGADFLQRAAEAGNISRETAFEHAQRGDLISPDLKWEDEKKRIVQEADLRKMLTADGTPDKPKAAD